MAITEATEARMSEANRARNAQDRKNPLLINVDDGRLVPNVPQLGGRNEDKARGISQILPHPKYRIYKGDPKASLEARMQYLATSGVNGRRAVMDSSTEADPALPAFDIQKATREDLVLFAMEQYGMALDEDGTMHLTTLRAKVKALAQSVGDLAN